LRALFLFPIKGNKTFESDGVSVVYCGLFLLAMG
jgi:hypothetical protein